MITNSNLKDSHGFLVGRVMSYDDGRQVLYDPHGFCLGTYQPIGNFTMNQHGNLVGSGNLLTMLLRD